MAAAKHNLREIGGAHVDPSRSSLNVVLAGPGTADEVAKQAVAKALAAAAVGGAAIVRKIARRNGTRAAEIIFGLPASTSVDCSAYFAECLRWVENTFGDVVLSAVVHMDESAPHAHVLMLPMRDGKWLGI